jgi:hypothetical protein
MNAAGFLTHVGIASRLEEPIRRVAEIERWLRNDVAAGDEMIRPHLASVQLVLADLRDLRQELR